MFARLELALFVVIASLLNIFPSFCSQTAKDRDELLCKPKIFTKHCLNDFKVLGKFKCYVSSGERAFLLSLGVNELTAFFYICNVLLRFWSFDATLPSPLSLTCFTCLMWRIF